MSRVRMAKKTLSDPGMAEMFNQMLGNEGDPEIVREKHDKLRTLFKVIHSILYDLGTGNLAKEFTEYKVWFDQISEFAEATKTLHESKSEYKALTADIQTRRIIMMCKDLMQHQKQLLSDPPSDKWIVEYPDTGYQLFEFSKFDIKQLWYNSKFRSAHRKYMLMVLTVLYKKSYDVYKIVTSPDINVGKFKHIILSSIDKVRGTPELNRCRDALDKITDSMSLLENNFDDYYKDMVQSQNPNTIIENFIIDVSKNQQMNPDLMRQFRQIINFYKSKTQSRIKDPKVKKLFDTLNEKMNMFDSGATRTPAPTLRPRNDTTAETGTGTPIDAGTGTPIDTGTGAPIDAATNDAKCSDGKKQ